MNYIWNRSLFIIHKYSNEPVYEAVSVQKSGQEVITLEIEITTADKHSNVQHIMMSLWF